jgi:ABC-2 type transport system ATP-binding protein
MLSLSGVARSYGEVKALDGVDLEIARGDILALLGPNGAGKTTLVSIVAGLLEPDAGRVLVGGIDVQRRPLDARRLIGVAPQTLGFYLQLTVLANMRFFGRMAGLGRRELDDRIEEVAGLFGLTDLLDRIATDLSGGEKRRLHTALALLHRPPLLLLDEPTAGVDVHMRVELLEVVKRMASEGAAVCYTTHYLHEVELLSASAAILEHGRIVAAGRVPELIEAHGKSVVEIRFDGPAPREAAVLGPLNDGGSVVRIDTPDPTAAVAQVFASMGSAAASVKGVEIVRPSLETAYLSITGRRFEIAPDGTDEWQP